MVSIASVATTHGIDILELIQAARQLDMKNWITPQQAEQLVNHVHSKYTLADKEIEDVEDFLLKDPRAQELFRQFVGLEHLVTGEESAQVLEAISRRLLQTLGPKYGRRLRQQDLTRVVLNLGVLDIYRSGTCVNNIEQFVGSVVIPYSPKLGENLLTRSYLNKMQTMTPDQAREYLEGIQQRWLHRDEKP